MLNGNLLTELPDASAAEVFQTLLTGGAFRLERIVSAGQVTPVGEWYDQEQCEWVVVLAGSARLRFEDEDDSRELVPGDHVWIAAHRRHRVQATDPDQPTVWLALHHAPED